MLKLITFDLNKPGKDYPDLFRSIKVLGDWCHPLQNLWIVESSLTNQQILDSLALDVNDQAFVSSLRDCSVKLDDQFVVWLRDRLG